MLVILNFLLLFKVLTGLLQNSNSLFFIFWGIIICLILSKVISVKEKEYLENNYSKRAKLVILILYILIIAGIYI